MDAPSDMTRLRFKGRVGRASWVMALALLGIAVFGTADRDSRVLGIIAGVVFVAVAATILGTLRRTIVVEDDAIAMFGLRGTARVAWSEVTHYRFEQFDETRWWTGRTVLARTRWRLAIESKAAPSVALDDSYDPALLRLVLPRIHASVRARKRSTFGAFVLEDLGLRHRDQLLAWDALEDVVIGSNRVLVHTHGRSRAWADAALRDVPCVLLLVELLEERGVRVERHGLTT
jgi:hypothetical protein